jgi:hypothetical protein
MGSPVTVAAVMARLTAHPGASARACCELSQGTVLPRACHLNEVVLLYLMPSVFFALLGCLNALELIVS